MRSRCFLVLLLACAVAVADPEEDLKFAEALGARGFNDMALAVLDALEKSSDQADARAGRFGKAKLIKQQATRARGRYLLALEEGRQPPITREAVIALYEEASPRIQEYVGGRKGMGQARFLLGEILQEYAEFLTGADYPDEMSAERDRLVGQNKEQASKLFEQAIKAYEQVRDEAAQQLGDKPALDDPVYILMSNAEFNVGIARYRWALVFQKGANFQYRIDEAIEVLDELYNKHYEDLIGRYAMIFLGRCFLEKSLRLGDPDDAQIATDYFGNVYRETEFDPAVPETADVIGRAFYWYVRACNVLASGAGSLKKAQPIFFENSIKAGSEIKGKLKQSIANEWALRALLEVADAHAAQRSFDDAVGLAGEVLATARVEAAARVGKFATAKLTNWVASVKGAGALTSSLLFQIGESLSGQNRIGNAITFYEKAVAAAEGQEEKETWAYPAQLRIASLYRKDKRYFAAAAVAWPLVEEFLKSGDAEDSEFGLTASEACNQTRLAWRTIADETKRPADDSQYKKVLDVFRDKFPGHPANSDKAYSEAAEVYGKGQFEVAAQLFRDISPSSRNYWQAQRRVPVCYRRLAQGTKDETKSKAFHEKCLEASTGLEKLAKEKPNEPGAVKALQYASLYQAMALASLLRWEEALTVTDAYLAKYPDQWLKRGLELDIKLHAHLALGQLEEAEAALAQLQAKQPDSSYLKGCLFDVYTALREKYKPMGTGQERQGLALRASKILEARLAMEKDLDESQRFALGDVMRDAQRWQDAADAFEGTAEVVADPGKKSAYKLSAAEMQFKAAKDGAKRGELGRKDYLELLNKTRQLFTDVLIVKKDQSSVLKALADWKNYPSKATFKKVKRRPEVLLTAAEVYLDSSPAGLDGRWISARLVAHLHAFTRAARDPAHPDLDKFIPIWWDGAELKIEAYLAIATSGSGQAARTAMEKGKAFVNKLTFQYQKMDGPERVTRIGELKRKFK